MIRFVRSATLAFLLAVATPALSHDSLQVDPEHGAVKDIIQHDSQTLPVIEDALVTLRRLIKKSEAAFGTKSPQIGLLLLDIGEAAIRRGMLLSGDERTDGIMRGVRAIDTGDPLLTQIEARYHKATVARARGQFLKGRALLVLGQNAEAEAALRRSLALHWNRFNDDVWQLQVFPFLFDAVQTSDAKLAVAQAELKIARAIYGNNLRVEQAEKRVREASTLGNAGLGSYDAARALAGKLADAGQLDEAYAALVDAMPSGTDARRIFAARIKPSPFFIYEDPDATGSKGWVDLQQDSSLSAYDLVATRFMVDNDLQPFIEEGRNALSALLDVMMMLYDGGNTNGARYFCRLLPQNYGGYTTPTFPDFCDTLDWVSWTLAMGSVGISTQLVEASLDLLPPADHASDAENLYRARALSSLLSIEAYYGSPDTFFAAYDQMVRSSARPDGDMTFYAAVISDDAEQALANLDSVLTSYPGNHSGNDTSIQGRSIGAKLSLVGGETARSICRSNDERISAVLRGIMCVTGQDPELVPYDQIESDIRDGLVDRGTPGVNDWPFLRIAGRPAIRAAIADNIPAFVPGLMRPFTKRELTPRETSFMKRPVSEDEFSRVSGGGFAQLMDEDFDPAHLSIALVQAGKLGLARSWARWGNRLYQSTDGPATVFTAYMAEAHSEESYRDGWAWMLAGHPVLAEAAFGSAIPMDLSYQRGAFSLEQTSSLSWERVIGAYHGRMLARAELGDKSGAAEDAAGLINYVSFVLNLQSFTRHETREIVVRVARPALLVALDLLASNPASDRNSAGYAFRAAQLLNRTGTGTTVNRLGARLTALSPELGKLAREREALRARWMATGSEQDAYRLELANGIDALDRRLAADFPKYVELAGTIDLPVTTVQHQLEAGEALVSYTLLEASTVALVVTRDETHVVPIDAGRQQLAYMVEDLRRGLDMQGGRLPSFRSSVAFDLYRTLISPVELALGDRPAQLILALSDVLESVPFSVLVTDPPGGKRLQELSWIVDRYAISRVPSVSSLVMMRQIAGATAAPDPFLGIGDPLLNGNGSDFRGLAVNEAFNTRGALDNMVLQSLPRLAETADELRQLQQTLGGSETALLLGEAASERRVKALPFGDFRVVAFATHGLVAGEIGGFNEPGLVLTPPAQPDNDDDGFLAASEIAELNLNAELVLLSACNTAAPGATGAEGLSGLAKAFFFAGAQALLVSHWSVESRSAAELTTRMMKTRMSNPMMNYAAALQEAMLSLRKSASGDFDHPALWGSFEIVGG